MSDQLFRPSLRLHLYGRPLHPELFDLRKTARIDGGAYAATLRILDIGHYIEWEYEALTLVQLVVPTDVPLPQKRRLLSCTADHDRREI